MFLYIYATTILATDNNEAGMANQFHVALIGYVRSLFTQFLEAFI